MKSKAGFVLIELLVAIFILAIIFSFIFTSFHGTIRIINAAEDSVYFFNTLEGAAEHIYYDITSIFKPDKNLQFNGEKTSLLFLTTYRLLPPREEGIDFALIQYILYQDPRSDDYILIRKEAERRQKLLGGIREVEFSFFDGLRWRGEWDSRERGKLPRGIRLRIVRVDEGSNEKSLVVNVPIPVG